MKTNEEMAKALYDLLVEDSENCADVDIGLYKSRVYYVDQGGEICYDFSGKTIRIEGNIRDTFGVETKEQMGDFVNTNTVELTFYKSDYRGLYASLSDQYETFEEMKSVMKEGGVCMYLDLDKVFK